MKYLQSHVRLLLVLSLITGWQLASFGGKPNIIIIMTDDQGWGDLSLHGNQTIETPQIDRLARQGVQFDRFYVQPVCSPTRAELLTGRYNPRGGIYSTSAGGERLDLDESTIAEVFKAAGYKTGIFGKWHNGSQYPYHPLGRGFDEFYGFTSGHWGLYFNPMIEHNGTMTRGVGYLPDDITVRAMDYAAACSSNNNPFFIYLAYNIPHSPMQVPDRFWDKFDGKDILQPATLADREIPDYTRAALAMCENVDWNVGRILRKVKSLGIERDTIILYMTDNGPNGDRWNGGMKGKKGSTDEGGVRSPFFVRWPGTVPAGKKVMQIAGAIDILPTLADMAGVPVKTNHPLDGISLKPLIMGNPDTWKDRMIFATWKGKVSVRTQRYRLDNNGQLYDMQADPGQLADASDQFPKVATQLRNAVDTFNREVNEGAFDTERPFLVGHEDFSISYLPARDAIAHGTIERSARPPNDSYFTNWTSVEDYLTWDVDVLTPGLYAADIWYACEKGDTGCQIELSFKDASVSSKIQQAHSPDFLGLKYQRFDRSESKVKIFQRYSLGTIRLESGSGTMRLSAPVIPGKKAIEFRLLSLTRIR